MTEFRNIEQSSYADAQQKQQGVTLSALVEMMSVLGQISDQVNGGRLALAGGTLADPALRIGDVGIYSAAAGTLSIAIAGVERARLTAAGLIVYGTITQG
ncbi:hypothetical protein PUH89_04005 [Rhodobacter capsulatus]|uniref:Uncharacterized protein n=1 Tax=Rhodobacter capsulatus TaxID=1061 RepID=A0A1G7PUT6_RHOCA|nr:hypothetical protein [Rhodobacter capsulatus]WER10165.1 hypothetical protein PUH89_04005 [Rhodobacter capsulatus]SDF89973.1 hypothetical protein SAMN04244550_03054 [Rhodobacter capsulatus]